MIQELRLWDFRCFPSICCDLSAPLVFFCGPNAAGKTTILESLCVLLRLQSPRASSLQKCIRSGAPAFLVEGIISGVRLQIRYDATGRKLHMDGVRQTESSEYLKAAKITWFSNDDLQLITGGGSARRRYLDFIGSQIVPGYRVHLRNFERALRSRNFLLKARSTGRQLDAYTEIFCQEGESLHAGRNSFFPRLAELFTQAASDIAGRQEDARIEFQPGFSSPLAEQLSTALEKDLRNGSTSSGPHRDDFLPHIGTGPAADFASEGQQRTLALALKLAQSRLLSELQPEGLPPVLLLDDVFGELDPGRRNRLLASLPPTSQKLITTTFLDWMEQPAGLIYQCPGGGGAPFPDTTR